MAEDATSIGDSSLALAKVVEAAGSVAEPLVGRSTAALEVPSDPPSSVTDSTTAADALSTNTLTPAFQSHSSLVLPSCADRSNFCRNVQWCADGSSVLGVMEGASVEVIDMNDDGLKHRLSLPQPAPILSTAWFPTASSTDPASYCFVAAVRDGPVKLLDASDGRLRASYRIVDHQERFVAPSCIAFNMYMNKLYCGFEDAIEVFDVYYPGEGTRLHTVPTKKSRDGLKGIISGLTFAPDWSGLYAAGSFSGAIALYTEDTGAQAQGWLDDGALGGVTQIRFNPVQAHIVYAAFRRTPTIARWDLRNPSEPVILYDRGSVGTNQRLHFDVSPDGRWVVAGDERGTVSVFDALGEERCSITSFNAHKDSIGAATFHPAKPFLLTASGSRHFEDEGSETSDSSSESSDMEDVEVLVSGAWSSMRRRPRQGPVTVDNSVKLWTHGAG